MKTMMVLYDDISVDEAIIMLHLIASKMTKTNNETAQIIRAVSDQLHDKYCARNYDDV